MVYSAALAFHDLNHLGNTAADLLEANITFKPLFMPEVILKRPEVVRASFRSLITDLDLWRRSPAEAFTFMRNTLQIPIYISTFGPWEEVQQALGYPQHFIHANGLVTFDDFFGVFHHNRNEPVEKLIQALRHDLGV